MATNNITINNSTYNGIATMNDVNSICKGSFSATGAEMLQCPPKSELSNVVGISIDNNTSYSDTQLVKFKDLSLKKSHSIIINVFNANNSETNSLTATIYWGTSSTSIPNYLASVSIGKVSKNSWSGEKTLSFTLPTKDGNENTIDYSKTQLWFNINCGKTGLKRKWSWSYGNTSYTLYDNGTQHDNAYTASIRVQNVAGNKALFGTGTNKVSKIHFYIDE